MSQPDFRMFAIDLDGTLLAPDGQATPRTRAAIGRAVAAGYQVCFATGRSLRESRPILESVGHLDGAVFVTGAVVVDMRTRTTLHRQLMPAGLARELCAFIEERGHAALALQDFDQTGLDYLASDGGSLHPSTLRWISMTQSSVQRRSDLATHDHALTLRVSIVASASEVDRCHAEMVEHFGSRVFCHNLMVPSCEIAVMEVFDPGVDKWQGVLRVARRHGIAPHQIVAIGDDVNDLPMIRQAGLGVAMGNARPHVRAAARRVIGHNGRDGLAEFLEEQIQIGTDKAKRQAGT